MYITALHFTLVHTSFHLRRSYIKWILVSSTFTPHQRIVMDISQWSLCNAHGKLNTGLMFGARGATTFDYLIQGFAQVICRTNFLKSRTRQCHVFVEQRFWEKTSGTWKCDEQNCSYLLWMCNVFINIYFLHWSRKLGNFTVNTVHWTVNSED